MARRRSKKNKSYIVVKDQAVTEPMAPPGVPNKNVQTTTDKNKSKEEGKE